MLLIILIPCCDISFSLLIVLRPSLKAMNSASIVLKKVSVCTLDDQVTGIHGLFTWQEYDALVSGVHQIPPDSHYCLLV